MEEYTEALSRTRCAVVPFGSVEEHGPHLPLGTDTMHATELARRASRIAPCIVAPPVHYGLTRSTSMHPGTLSLSGATLKALAVEIGLSLWRQGMRGIVFLSGHAGGTHMAYLVDAGEELLSRTEELSVAVLSVIDIQREACRDLIETEWDSHAGEVETSLVAALRPELVKGTARAERPSFPKHILVRDKRSHWPGGVWGDPEPASKEKGEAILEREAAYLAELIRRLEPAQPT